jgi:uncharacterized membrane protein (UPF0127 family)
MKHLPIPFETIGEIRLLRKKKLILSLPVEVGLSPIEHFQGLLYRKEIKKGTGLLFIFENPNLPTLVNFSAQFGAESIQVDEDGKIRFIAKMVATKGSASFVTAFQCKYLLIVEKGFCKKHSTETYNFDCSNNLKPTIIEFNIKK